MRKNVLGVTEDKEEKVHRRDENYKNKIKGLIDRVEDDKLLRRIYLLLTGILK